MVQHLVRTGPLPRRDFASSLSIYLNLAKVKILALVAVAALSTAIVAGGGRVPLRTALLLLLATALSSAGAAFLNNYFDRDIDAVMERTKSRPLPAGKIRPLRVLLLGLALVAASLPVALLLNYTVAIFAFAGALVYCLIYTLWLKRRTSLNIVIGGLAGSCAVLAGWFATASSISLTPVLLALLLFLWTPSHFWSLAVVFQKSYQQADVPMLPVLVGTKRSADYILLSTGLLLLVSLGISFLSSFGKVYLAGAVILGILFLALNIMLRYRPERAWAWRNFKFSGLYLLGLFSAMVLDAVVSRGLH